MQRYATGITCRLARTTTTSRTEKCSLARKNTISCSQSVIQYLEHLIFLMNLLIQPQETPCFPYCPTFQNERAVLFKVLKLTRCRY